MVRVPLRSLDPDATQEEKGTDWMILSVKLRDCQLGLMLCGFCLAVAIPAQRQGPSSMSPASSPNIRFFCCSLLNLE